MLREPARDHLGRSARGWRASVPRSPLQRVAEPFGVADVGRAVEVRAILADRLDRLGRGALAEDRRGDVARQDLGPAKISTETDEQGQRPSARRWAISRSSPDMERSRRAGPQDVK